MEAELTEAPTEAFLEERRRLGHDHHDELWDGVLHMNPQPRRDHQAIAYELHRLLTPVADSLGLHCYGELNFWPSDSDYRVPDGLIARQEQLTEMGVDGAVLVIEVRSPRDESYAKLQWYADRGIEEALIAHPNGLRAELFRSTGSAMEPVEPDPDGFLTVRSVPVRIGHAEVTGHVHGVLRLVTPDGVHHDIDPDR